MSGRMVVMTQTTFGDGTNCTKDQYHHSVFASQKYLNILTKKDWKVNETFVSMKTTNFEPNKKKTTRPIS